MSNKKSGTMFEDYFCELAGQKGFWAHLLQANQDGQPADVIIAKYGVSVIIDCKDCEHDRFSFDRIEENQKLAMAKWIKTGNKHAWFALKLSNGVWMVSFDIIQKLAAGGFASINANQIERVGRDFDFWVRVFDNEYENKNK